MDKDDKRIVSASLNKVKRQKILELLKQEKYKDGLAVTEITNLVGMGRRDVNSYMNFLLDRGDVIRFKGVNRNPNGGKHKEVYYYALNKC
ncbi:hypothetical protein [Bartonella sp. DGB1]|uniref:hypothetical protein n=1 Tax=Bartonella sp. DGB1 TaxID=3239807 RepID=UPI003526B6E3